MDNKNNGSVGNKRVFVIRSADAYCNLEVTMKDPVIRDLNKHLAEIDQQEALRQFVEDTGRLPTQDDCVQFPDGCPSCRDHKCEIAIGFSITDFSQEDDLDPYRDGMQL